MRVSVVVCLIGLLAAVPTVGRGDLAAVAAEFSAGAIAVGTYSCFVVGIFSDIMDFSAAARGVSLSDVSLPRATALIAGGTALIASPLVAAAAVSAVGSFLGQTSGPAYALSVASAYVAAALVFDYEWRSTPTSGPDWLPAWIPEWAVRLTLATSLAATVGFSVGIAIH